MPSILPALAFTVLITAQFASVIAARVATPSGPADRTVPSSVPAAREQQRT